MAYKTLHDSYYNDPDVRALALGPDHLLQYLILNPHSHFSGIYYLPLSVVPAESKLTVEDIRQCMDTLSGKYITPSIGYQYPTDRVSGDCESEKHWFIYYDERYQIMYVKSMLRGQTSGHMSSRQIRSVLNHIVQFIKSSALIRFLDYHRPYFTQCFEEMEKSRTKKDAERAREAQLKSDVAAFYDKIGLSFFGPDLYPIRALRQEEASEAAKASASENSLFAHGANSDESEAIFRIADRLFGISLQRNLPIRNVDYACQQIQAGQLKVMLINNPNSYLRSDAASPGPDYVSYAKRKQAAEAKKEALINKNEHPQVKPFDPEVKAGIAAIAAGKPVEVQV